MSAQFQPLQRRRVQPRAADLLKVKVVAFGDPYVGKTALVRRFCDNTFSSSYSATVGVDFFCKRVTLRGKEVSMNVWDLSGQEEFSDVRSEFFKDAHAGILFYDTTSRKSFLSLDLWLSEAMKFGGKDTQYIVCATKSESRARAVAESEGRQWASSRGFPFIETSAFSGSGVRELFESKTFDSLMHRN
uniref:Uncharacterized protein n=1 Tax=Chromera velia CCMP2878 TaxID=1169474 RepID=A0A0G4HF16_9ALVE|eukprot:Cvel_26758.t1-p1 / transcript=Cvel_26758.t1 / gene=Cvel_26758 / organism=Chromera_velia_CCMP2878 / gene_product=DnaJ homolog subfamily C member 27, putative / transcript_product=DnaJ homolog subfamily C member 27, putative / location=Cvel_scaffold3233:10911-12067(-) / protein_length=187 / sequence_SO=supercontig / SO=protein_coding / is_pseudo=false